MNFFSQWLARFGLSPQDWPEQIALHVEKLPFIAPDVSEPLLEFLFGDVPAIVAANPDVETALLADAYAWCCHAFWQCESAFPALPENYAGFLKTALETPTDQRDESAVVLARLVSEFNAGDGQCGFNRFVLKDAKTIRESEQINLDGDYEVYLKAQDKYDEYVFRLQNSPEFQAEWNLIKTTYAYFLDDKEKMRRSPIPERNWHRGAKSAQFDRPWHLFKAVFDFFCWKYYLWGMQGDTPMLLKPYAVCTPHGTQIFIPGYLSFDAKRDLDFARITKLHRARGVPYQGPSHFVGRREQIELKRLAKEADAKARSRGDKGDARYASICKALKLEDTGDYRQIRALLSAGKKKPKKIKTL